jgi:predicted ATPase
MDTHEINDIKRQFANGEWRKFLSKITLDNLRGWGGQSVEFRFPVCAIAGVNGAGKSTVLRAAVCAYKNEGGKTVYPSQLFLNTQWDTGSVDDAEIKYEVKQGEQSAIQGRWKKTNDWGYSPKSKWPKRTVYFLDQIIRAMPLDATAGYAKIAKQVFSTNGGELSIPSELMREYSHIMEKVYPSARFVTPQPRHDVGLLKSSDVEISQFHQGAGEDALLDLMKDLASIPDTSLLIIDEVESSLHPRAQRRLVRFLLKLARQKKLQIILSTHSPYILEELPPEGRILILKATDGKNVQYGVSTNYAMGLIDDVLQPDLSVYVEDKEAKTLVSRLVNGDDDLRRRIEIIEVGASNVVDMLGRLARENKLPIKGVAIVDGDKRGEAKNCCPLPSNDPPEKLVFDGLKAKGWANLDNRFGVGAGLLFSFLDDALTNPDPHEYTTQVGNQVKKSKDQVWDIMVDEWCKQCLDPAEKDRIISTIKHALPVV